jgi:hypothetical protein
MGLSSSSCYLVLPNQIVPSLPPQKLLKFIASLFLRFGELIANLPVIDWTLLYLFAEKSETDKDYGKGSSTAELQVV